MTLADLLSDLRIGVGNPSTSDVPDSQLTSCINKAQRYLGVTYPNLSIRKFGTITTIIGTASYATAADVFAVRNVFDTTNNYKLVKRGDRWNAQQVVTGATTARSTSYITYDGLIKLWPVPDGVYNLYYQYSSTVTDMVNSTDVPSLPIPWHDAITFNATWWYYSWIRQDIPKAQVALATLGIFLASMPTRQELESVDIDSAVEVPTLDPNSLKPRLNFDQSA